MKRSSCALICLAVILNSCTALHAEFIWQDIGNIKNPGDPTVRRGGLSGFGSVDYQYSIGKSPISYTEYAVFLNSVARVSDPMGLYDGRMDRIAGQILKTGEEGNYSYSLEETAFKPLAVNFVDVYDAMRYANWVNNGMPVGLQDASTTEDGSYTITEEGIALHNITRNPGAGIFLPTENEWYKAAYYEPGASDDNYWDYPTRSDTAPSLVQVDENNNAISGNNVASYSNSPKANLGSIGSGSDSFYGVSDLAGQLWEWTETIITRDEFTTHAPPGSNPPSNGTWRAIQGGSRSSRAEHLSSFWRHPEDPFDADFGRGIRLVSIQAVPEPSGLFIVLLLGSPALLRRRRPLFGS